MSFFSVKQFYLKCLSWSQFICATFLLKGSSSFQFVLEIGLIGNDLTLSLAAGAPLLFVNLIKKSFHVIFIVTNKFCGLSEGV